MSWSSWKPKNVGSLTSIVSQGLEQVAKLKEDVEKQFDQAVAGAGPTPSSSASLASSSYATSLTASPSSNEIEPLFPVAPSPQVQAPRKDSLTKSTAGSDFVTSKYLAEFESDEEETSKASTLFGGVQADVSTNQLIPPAQRKSIECEEETKLQTHLPPPAEMKKKAIGQAADLFGSFLNEAKSSPSTSALKKPPSFFGEEDENEVVNKLDKEKPATPNIISISPPPAPSSPRKQAVPSNSLKVVAPTRPASSVPPPSSSGAGAPVQADGLDSTIKDKETVLTETEQSGRILEETEAAKEPVKEAEEITVAEKVPTGEDMQTIDLPESLHSNFATPLQTLMPMKDVVPEEIDQEAEDLAKELDGLDDDEEDESKEEELQEEVGKPIGGEMGRYDQPLEPDIQEVEQEQQQPVEVIPEENKVPVIEPVEVEQEHEKEMAHIASDTEPEVPIAETRPHPIVAETSPPPLAEPSDVAEKAAVPEPSTSPPPSLPSPQNSPPFSPKYSTFPKPKSPTLRPHSSSSPPPSSPPPPPLSFPKTSPPPVDIATDDSETSVLKAKLKELKSLLAQREQQLMSSSLTITELHEELDKTCHREVVAVEKARHFNDQVENLKRELLQLSHHTKSNTAQKDQDIFILQNALTEKEEKLQALLEEGQSLSKKQAHIEQRLRVLRKEKNEEEEAKLRFQTQLDLVSTSLQEITIKYKHMEEENKKNIMEIRTLQQALEQMTMQFSKTNFLLDQKTKEYQVLEVQHQDLVQVNTRLSSQVDKMQDQSQIGHQLRMEKEQLEQTIHFLQANLNTIEEENKIREEKNRQEIFHLKTKWQQALLKIDTMALSVTQATQPLLTQIHFLQEEFQKKEKEFHVREANLMVELKEIKHVNSKLKEEMQQQVNLQTTNCLNLEKEFSDKLQENKNQWLFEKNVEIDKQKQEKELEKTQLKLFFEKNQEINQQNFDQEIQNLETQFHIKLQKYESEIDLLQKQILELQKQSECSRSRSSSSSTTYIMAPSSSTSTISTMSNQAAMILQDTLENGNEEDEDGLGELNGNTSVLGLSQIQQKLRMKESENRMLKQQLDQLEQTKQTNTQELIRLSTRMALIETNEQHFQQTKQELEQIKQHYHLLMELFGEKEEELEELQQKYEQLAQNNAKEEE